MLHAHLSYRAGKVGQLVADVTSKLSLTYPMEGKNYSERKNWLLCTILKWPPAMECNIIRQAVTVQ
jgi:hypothetical protein